MVFSDQARTEPVKVMSFDNNENEMLDKEDQKVETGVFDSFSAFLLRNRGSIISAIKIKIIAIIRDKGIIPY